MKRLALSVALCSIALLVSCGSLPASALQPAIHQTRINHLALIRTQLAVELLKNEDYRNALKSINEAIAADDRYLYAWLVKGEIYQTIKNYPAADQAYRQALTLQPASAEANNDYGWFVCQALKEPQKAIDHFDKALADLTYPTPEMAYANKGVCLSKMGDQTGAENNLRQALKVNPDFNYANWALSQVHYDEGKFHSAAHYFALYHANKPRLNADELDFAIALSSRLGNKRSVKAYRQELLQRYPYSDAASKYSGI